MVSSLNQILLRTRIPEIEPLSPLLSINNFVNRSRIIHNIAANDLQLSSVGLLPESSVI